MRKHTLQSWTFDLVVIAWIAAGILSALCPGRLSAEPNPAVPGSSPADSAAPTPPAKPLKRVLLVTHSGGFVHGSVATAESVLRQRGPAEGFEVTCFRFTNDPDKPVKVKRRVDGREVEVQTTALEAYSAKFPGGVTRDQCGRLDAATLAKFDTVIFFTTGNPAETRDEQTALLDYVLKGGGFVGTHCATDTHYGFADYGRMIGGYFDGHPWHTKVTVRVEEPSHPLVAHWGEAFEITDEIYQHRAPYSRSELRVLASLSPEWLAQEAQRRDRQRQQMLANLDAELANRQAAAQAKASKLLEEARQLAQAQDSDTARATMQTANDRADKLLKEPNLWAEGVRKAKPGHGGRRADDDYAIAWCRTLGDGRVFYTALGHRDEVWRDERFQTMLWQALRWTTRQIEAESAPRGPTGNGQ